MYVNGPQGFGRRRRPADPPRRVTPRAAREGPARGAGEQRARRVERPVEVASAALAGETDAALRVAEDAHGWVFSFSLVSLLHRCDGRKGHGPAVQSRRTAGGTAVASRPQALGQRGSHAQGRDVDGVGRPGRARRACRGGAAGDAQVKVLSNRADIVSGGDALVQVVPPAGVRAAKMRVEVDGRDVTGRSPCAPAAGSSAWSTGCATARTSSRRPPRAAAARG